jgi:hypothetical protein
MCGRRGAARAAPDVAGRARGAAGRLGAAAAPARGGGARWGRAARKGGPRFGAGAVGATPARRAQRARGCARSARARARGRALGRAADLLWGTHTDGSGAPRAAGWGGARPAHTLAPACTAKANCLGLAVAAAAAFRDTKSKRGPGLLNAEPLGASRGLGHLETRAHGRRGAGRHKGDYAGPFRGRRRAARRGTVGGQAAAPLWGGAGPGTTFLGGVWRVRTRRGASEGESLGYSRARLSRPVPGAAPWCRGRPNGRGHGGTRARAAGVRAAGARARSGVAAARGGGGGVRRRQGSVERGD